MLNKLKVRTINEKIGNNLLIIKIQTK